MGKLRLTVNEEKTRVWERRSPPRAVDEGVQVLSDNRCSICLPGSRRSSQARGGSKHRQRI